MNIAHKEIPGIPSKGEKINSKGSEPRYKKESGSLEAPEQERRIENQELAEQPGDMRSAIEDTLFRTGQVAGRELRIMQKSLASLPDAFLGIGTALTEAMNRRTEQEEDPDAHFLTQKPRGVRGWLKNTFGGASGRTPEITQVPMHKESRGAVMSGGEVFKNIAQELTAFPDRLNAFLQEFGTEGLERRRTEAHDAETRAWHAHADVLQELHRERKAVFAQKEAMDEGDFARKIAELDDRRADADYAYEDAVARAEGIAPGTAEAVIASTISMAASGIPRALLTLGKETASLMAMGGTITEYGGKMRQASAELAETLPKRVKNVVEGLRKDIPELGKDIRNLQRDFSATTQAILLDETYVEHSIYTGAMKRRMEKLSVQARLLPMEQQEIDWIQKALKEADENRLTRDMLENVERLLENMEGRAAESTRAQADSENFNALAGYITARALERVKNLSGVPDRIRETLVTALRESPTPDTLNQVHTALFAMQDESVRIEGMDYLTPEETQEIAIAQKETEQALARVTDLFEQSLKTQVARLKTSVAQAKRNLTLAQAELATEAEDETGKIGSLAAK